MCDCWCCRSSSVVHNPHIRAKLAQLVLLIAGVGGSPRRAQGLLPSVSLLFGIVIILFIFTMNLCFQYSDSQREVFASHHVATQHLLPALMTIFIDIEFTGESMEFEDKFREHSKQEMFYM